MPLDSHELLRKSYHFLSLLTRWNAHPPSSNYQSITWDLRLPGSLGDMCTIWKMTQENSWFAPLYRAGLGFSIFFFGEVVACKLVRGANTAKLTSRFGIIVEVSKYRKAELFGRVKIESC